MKKRPTACAYEYPQPARFSLHAPLGKSRHDRPFVLRALARVIDAIQEQGACSMTNRTDCPICEIDDERIFLNGEAIIGVWDTFPASPGHALLITRRHVASWFELSSVEQQEIIAGLDHAKSAIESKHDPDGYNNGINSGAAAGQTVFHLHLHLIPRYTGDVADPQGVAIWTTSFPGQDIR